MAATKISTFGKISSREKIDKALGIIYGVSVITAGPAEGHDIIIDKTTLSQVREVAAQFSDGVKVRLNHPPDGKSAQIQSITGALKNFRTDGNHVRADLHLLKSDDDFSKILELAETQPENFGLSLMFSGVPEQSDDLKLARCVEIYACDLVDAPAANVNGLFSKNNPPMKIKYAKGNDGDHASDCECEKCCKMSKKDERMSAILSGLGLSEDATAEQISTKLKTALSKPAASPMTEIVVKLEDGTEQTLSGAEISKQLKLASKLVSDTTVKLAKAERDTIISKMDAQGRVPFNPAKGVAYTLEELQQLPIEMLQVLAVNAPILPLEAKAIFKGSGKPKLDANLKGSARTVAALENNGYASLSAMKARHNLN